MMKIWGRRKRKLNKMVDMAYIIQMSIDHEKTIWADAITFNANSDNAARKVLADFLKDRSHDTVRLWKMEDLKNVGN
jgi:hypothetical protein